jgi:cell division protein FtsB
MVPQPDGVLIPGWALWAAGVCFPFIISWLLWLTFNTFRNKQAIAVNDVTNSKVYSELEKIYDSMATGNKELSSRMDKLDDKLDRFMMSELSLLKQHLTK